LTKRKQGFCGHVLQQTEIEVADEVFLATALLHREQPGREDFTIREIVERVRKENLRGELRRGVQVQVLLHCVANRPPAFCRHRMLYATGKGTRRLLLASDEVHPDRTGKIWPEPQEVPVKYRELIEWAKRRYGQEQPVERWLEGVLQTRGMGRELWKDEDPDAYVRNLREGWA
jgi:hypothetical protein